MMYKRLWILFWGVYLIFFSCEKGGERYKGPQMAIVGVDILTMENEEILRDQTILIVGDSIVKIGNTKSINLSSVSKIIDGSGLFVMPGLIDAHIHLRHADSTDLLAYLEAGITGAREMNGRPFLLKWRDQINAGTLEGPWLKLAAPTIGNFSSPREGFPTPKTKEEAIATIKNFHSEGYDWIKVYSFVNGEAFEAIIEEAKRLNIPVGGHVPVMVGLDETLNSKIQTIEHLTEYVSRSLTYESKKLDDQDFRSIFGAGEVNWETLDTMVEMTKEMGAWNIPSLVWFDRNLPVSFAEEAWSDEDLRAQGAKNRREIVRRLYEAGARLGVGTDSDNDDDLSAAAIVDELEAMAECGIDPMAVLQMATKENARMLGVLEKTGTISVGKQADLLLLPCDPSSDLSCLREIKMVISKGKIVVE